RTPPLPAGAAPGAIQSRPDPTSQVIFQADRGARGNNARAKVPAPASLAIIPAATPAGALGTFIDDDGIVAAIASFVACSVGSPGPVVDGLLTWNDISHPQPASVLPNNGPP